MHAWTVILSESHNHVSLVHLNNTINYLYNSLLFDMYCKYSMRSWRLCIHVCAGSGARESSLLQTIEGLAGKKHLSHVTAGNDI